MEKKNGRITGTGRGGKSLSPDGSAQSAFEIFDNTLAADNLENDWDITAADRQDL